MSRVDVQKLLIERLADLAGSTRVVFIGEGSLLIGKAVANAGGHIQAVVLIDNAAEMKQISSECMPPNLDVHLGTSLDVLEGLIDVVIVICSGYDSNQSLTDWIKDAACRLRKGGLFYLITHTHVGGKTHQKMLNSIFGNVMVVARGQGGKRILLSTRTENAAIGVMRDHILIQETILGKQFQFITRPEVFSKNRIDVGSLLLLKSLPRLSGARILDLGCGYGVLGIVLAKLYPDTHVTLVDYDLMAVELAQENSKQNAVESNTEILLSDGLSNVSPQIFDVVVSHLPLHIPRAHLLRILDEVKNSLTDGGKLYAVALSNYTADECVRLLFGQVNLVNSGPPDVPSQYTLITAGK